MFNDRQKKILADRCPQSHDIMDKLNETQKENVNFQPISNEKNKTSLPKPKPIILNNKIKKCLDDHKAVEEVQPMLVQEIQSYKKLNEVIIDETPFGSSSRALFGPPGFTPFTTKHSYDLNTSYLNIDQVEEMIDDVKFDTILNDLTSLNFVTIHSGLERLFEIFQLKSKISVLNISKLQESFIKLLSSSEAKLVDKILDTLTLFIGSYNFQVDNWIHILIQSILKLASIEFSNSLFSDKIYKVLNVIQLNTNDESILSSVFDYIDKLELEADPNIIDIIMQYFFYILNMVNNSYENEHYFNVISKMIHWHKNTKNQARACSVQFENIFIRLQELNQTLFIIACKALSHSDKNYLAEIGDFDKIKENAYVHIINVPENYITPRRYNPKHYTQVSDKKFEPRQPNLLESNANSDTGNTFTSLTEINQNTQSQFKILNEQIENVIDRMKNDLVNNYSEGKKECIINLKLYLTQNINSFIKHAHATIELLSFIITKDNKIDDSVIGLLSLILLIIPIKNFITILFELFSKPQLDDDDYYIGLLLLLQYILYHKSFVDRHKIDLVDFIPILLQVIYLLVIY
ncbi:hypothetical protein HZS_122 [Henneguya salminicola]|nr:hypothetical protein HZS_122 [Henneguya salminicola]